MQALEALFRALDHWSSLLTDRESRRRALEVSKCLLAAIVEYSLKGRYGSFSVKIDFEAGKIVHWREFRDEGHK